MENLQPTLNIKTVGPKIKPKMENRDNPMSSHIGGSYAVVSAEQFIALRSKFVKNTLLTAKLPKPVSVSNTSIVREQPARNINDLSQITLNDLSFNDQEEVLGKDPKKLFTIANTKISEKLRNTQEVEFINNPPRLSGQQIKQILERI